MPASCWMKLERGVVAISYAELNPAVMSADAVGMIRRHPRETLPHGESRGHSAFQGRVDAAECGLAVLRDVRIQVRVEDVEPGRVAEELGHCDVHGSTRFLEDTTEIPKKANAGESLCEGLAH